MIDFCHHFRLSGCTLGLTWALTSGDRRVTQITMTIPMIVNIKNSIPHLFPAQNRSFFASPILLSLVLMHLHFIRHVIVFTEFMLYGYQSRFRWTFIQSYWYETNKVCFDDYIPKLCGISHRIAAITVYLKITHKGRAIIVNKV